MRLQIDGAFPRRDFLVVGLGALVGCAHRNGDLGGVRELAPPRDSEDAPEGRAGHPPLRPWGAIGLWSWFDLPASDPRSRELSGIAWDPKERVLWAVQDKSPSIIELVPDRDLRSWSLRRTITIDVGPPLDLEGLVVLPDGFIVCSEEGPRVIEVDRRGRLRREVPVPPRFREALTNKSLESLTMSPSGRHLFTTSESALARDGESATTSSGARIRIVRMARDPHDEFRETSEHVYETDPTPYEGGDWGVSDMAALSDDELFVLERGWAKGYGNTVRIYGVSLDNRASCLGVDQLSRSSATLPKTLRVDLGRLGVSRFPPPKQPQANAVLDNYEGLAFGPRLANGQSSLIVVSDDNGNDNQFARILVLSL